MAPQKGKQGTKGQKQIFEENRGTLKFYAAMAGAAEFVYISVMIIFFWEQFTILTSVILLFSIMIYAGSLQFMNYMAKASFSETGQLVDAGIDLNMEAGISEHLKDLIILTAAVQVLSLFSNYIIAFWLLAPGRAFYLLWTNIIAPWVFTSAPEVDEKKQKKMERKARRR